MLIDQLKALPPLGLIHHSWPFIRSGGHPMMATSYRPLLVELLRLCRSIPLSANWASKADVDYLIDASPADAQVCITLQDPYERSKGNVRDWGVLYEQDSARTSVQLSSLDDWIGDRRTVGCVMVDCECWQYPRDEAQNMTRKYAVVYQQIKAVWPNAHVCWYDRGSPLYTSNGWTMSKTFTLAEPGDSLSVALYAMGEYYLMLDYYRHASATARQRAAQYIVPFVPLGWQITRTIDRSAPANPLLTVPTFARFSPDVPYPVEHSWGLGNLLKKRDWISTHTDLGDWSKVPFVMLHPEIDPGRLPVLDHLLAYCQGWAGV